MKEIILMLLPLYLRSTSNASMLTISLMLLSFSSLAHDNDIAIRTGVGFYNGVSDEGSVSEDLSSNFVLGAQLPIKGSWAVSLDGFFFENNAASAYLGTTLDYKTEVSDDFDLYARLGADFISGEAIPKIAIGLEANINKYVALTMETVARDTDRFAGYQFILGAKYKFATDYDINNEVNENNPIMSEQIPEVAKAEVTQMAQDDLGQKVPQTHYKVVEGDNLWNISKHFDINLKTLISLNGDKIRDPDLIYPGTILKL